MKWHGVDQEAVHLLTAHGSDPVFQDKFIENVRLWLQRAYECGGRDALRKQFKCQKTENNTKLPTNDPVLQDVRIQDLIDLVYMTWLAPSISSKRNIISPDVQRQLDELKHYVDDLVGKTE